MPDVVELLELLHGNTPRWQNLRAVVVHRVDPAAREAPPCNIEQGRSGGTPVDLRPVDRRWLEARYELTAAVDPLRLRMTRLDYAGNDPQGVPPESAVDDGQVLWEQVALRVNRARHRRPHNRHVRAAEWLLMPRDLAVCHQLSITGTQTRDGRATWKVHAEPLPADLRPLVLPTPRHGLRGELEIDAELGVVVAADWTKPGGVRLTRSASRPPARPVPVPRLSQPADASGSSTELPTCHRVRFSVEHHLAEDGWCAGPPLAPSSVATATAAPAGRG